MGGRADDCLPFAGQPQPGGAFREERGPPVFREEVQVFLWDNTLVGRFLASGIDAADMVDVIGWGKAPDYHTNTPFCGIFLSVYPMRDKASNRGSTAFGAVLNQANQ